MALTTRDWWVIGITTGVCFLAFTTIGRRTLLVGMGATKAEAERLLRKIEKKAEKRAKP